MDAAMGRAIWTKAVRLIVALRGRRDCVIMAVRSADQLLFRMNKIMHNVTFVVSQSGLF